MEPPEAGMERYYLGVGRIDNVSPRDIVGAIANEADLDSKYIGHIKLFDKFSTVDLPEDMPEEVLHILRKMTIKNRPSKIRLMTDEPPPKESRGSSPRREGRDKKDSFFNREKRNSPRGEKRSSSRGEGKTRRFGR